MGDNMRRALIAMSIFTVTPFASSADLYRCKSDAGTVYQETPCQAAKAGGIVHSGVAAPTKQAAADTQGQSQADTASAREKKFVNDAERSRKIREANHEIAMLEEANQRATKAMDSELAALRERKGRTNNNLAGATLEGSISAEMQAVTTRYTSEINQNNDKIKRLREDIERLRKQS